MRVTSDTKLHSIVELTEAVGGFPAGRKGGVVERYSDGTLLIELIDDPSLGALERLVLVPPEKLRPLSS